MKRAALFAALLSCTNPFAPFAPGPAVVGLFPMDPPPAQYAGWYADTEACLGLEGSFSSVSWYVADSIEGAFGFTADDRIVIREDVLTRRQTVRHEAAHHITGEGSSIHFEHGTRALCDGGPYYQVTR